MDSIGNIFMGRGEAFLVPTTASVLCLLVSRLHGAICQGFCSFWNCRCGTLVDLSIIMWASVLQG